MHQHHMSDTARRCHPPTQTLHMHRMLGPVRMKQMQQMTLLLEYLELWCKFAFTIGHACVYVCVIFLEFLSYLKLKKGFERNMCTSSYSNGGFEGAHVHPSLVLGHVLFKQAPVRGYAHHFVDHCRILKLAVCQPNLHNAEILFG